MQRVLFGASPLLFGMFLLMVGNGLQGTALGLRGSLEAFGNLAMGFVMSGYFAGFLLGARMTPVMLRRVGHVRVFAALASIMSAAMILYGAIVDPVFWILLRVIVGFSMSGVYVVAESWLNEGTDNAHRGQVLSAYLIVQMLGIVLAQSLINVADPAGYELFVIMAVVVSVAVVPILLSATPAPVFEHTRQMTLRRLLKVSPLGCVGTILLGGVFACLFGMASVWASEIGLSTGEISIFIGAIYLGGMLLQYPIGWLSDRMDRRLLIICVTLTGAAACLLLLLGGPSLTLIATSAFVIGGMANPLYSLLIAHTNDFLEPEDMPAAAGGLIMLNGIGAVGTPILVGFLMDAVGNAAFVVFIGALLLMIAGYALYRSTQRKTVDADDTVPWTPHAMTATSVAATAASEYAAEAWAESQESSEAGTGAETTDPASAPRPE